MVKEKVPLADGLYLGADVGNQNILVIGSTGSGKTTSIVEPILQHALESSLVIPIVKRRIFQKYAPLLEEKGYEVIDLNFANPKLSARSFNPLEGITSESQILELAGHLAGCIGYKALTGESDPYWGEATMSVIGAEIGLAVKNAKEQGRQATFEEVSVIHSSMDMDFSGSHAVSCLDGYFEAMEERYPESNAPRLWKTLSGNASKTASCIYSMVNNVMDKLTGEDSRYLFCRKNLFSLEQIGEKKTAVFITTSPASVGTKKITDLFYSCIFRILFEESVNCGGELPVPVRIIADDFACGSRIPGFAGYISVFREAGISCVLMLQSLSQLSSMYGAYESKVIEDNCDTRVYLGSSDLYTVHDIARRLDVPDVEVLELPIGKVIVSMRGKKTVVYNRYPILEEYEF